MSAACGALDPAAPLIFSLSPLVGSPLTTSAKFAVVAKSPSTNRISDSLCSSHFAIAAKRAGFDALVIVGACRRPSALLIDNGRVEIRPADDLWGLSADDAGTRLRNGLGPAWRVAAIGLAGENLVKFATISHDGRHAGRGGMGAVLGAKRIKAVAVRGDGKLTWHDTAGLVAKAHDLAARSQGAATEKYRKLGTAADLLAFNRLGTLPTRNFSESSFESAAAISAETLTAALPTIRESCAACTIGCEHIVRQPNGAGVRMEYENLFALGPLCGVGDPAAVLAASAACDRLGLDTISAGGTIAFAMECAQRGLIDAPDLRFGRGDSLPAILEDIAHRRGLGDLLAEGSRAAAERIGGDAPKFAPHVKGFEIPGYEPRALQTMALGFAVGSRGADHNRSGAYEADFSEGVNRLHGGPKSAALAVATEDKAAIMTRSSSASSCAEPSPTSTRKAPRCSGSSPARTLRPTGSAKLRPASSQPANTSTSAKAGPPAEDTLPERFLSEGLPTGASAGARLPRERLEGMVRAYNLARGWSPEGWIPPDQVRALGLGD